MEKIRNAHEDFVGQSERKSSHEGLENIQNDIIKMFIKINVWKPEQIRLDICWNKRSLFMKVLLILFG